LIIPIFVETDWVKHDPVPINLLEYSRLKSNTKRHQLANFPRAHSPTVRASTDAGFHKTTDQLR